MVSIGFMANKQISNIEPGLPSCMCFAAALTIFYKRNFRMENLTLLFFLTLAGISLNRSRDSASKTSDVINGALLSATLYCCMHHLKWLKSLSGNFFIAMLAAVFDCKFDILRNMILHFGILNKQSTDVTFKLNCFRIFLVVIPQFIRKPSHLKAKLQGVRSKLGPIYVLYCTKLVSQYTCDNTALQMCAYTSVLAAVISGIVFRPDNSAVLESLGISTKLNQRRKLHGRGMLLSLLCILLLTVHKLRNQYSASDSLTFVRI